MLTKKHENSIFTKYSLIAVALSAQQSIICQQSIAQLEKYKQIFYSNLFFCIFFFNAGCQYVNGNTIYRKNKSPQSNSFSKAKLVLV